MTDFAAHTTDVAETFVSPSGQTTVYLVIGGGLDSSFAVGVSAGGLFPLLGGAVSSSKNTPVETIPVGWRGPLFMIGDQLIPSAFGETDHRAYSYHGWTRGLHAIHDPPAF